VALLRKMTWNLRLPMSFRHPVADNICKYLCIYQCVYVVIYAQQSIGKKPSIQVYTNMYIVFTLYINIYILIYTCVCICIHTSTPLEPKAAINFFFFNFFFSCSWKKPSIYVYTIMYIVFDIWEQVITRKQFI